MGGGKDMCGTERGAAENIGGRGMGGGGLGGTDLRMGLTGGGICVGGIAGGRFDGDKDAAEAKGGKGFEGGEDDGGRTPGGRRKEIRDRIARWRSVEEEGMEREDEVLGVLVRKTTKTFGIERTNRRMTGSEREGSCPELVHQVPVRGILVNDGVNESPKKSTAKEVVGANAGPFQRRKAITFLDAEEVSLLSQTHER